MKGEKFKNGKMNRKLRWTLATILLALGPAPARADAPPGRYQISTDTVFDTTTRLTWPRTYAPSPGPENNMNWGEASTYCAARGAGWRLPTVTELQSILDYSNETGELYDHQAFMFPDHWATMWTSTTLRKNDTYAWVVRLNGHTVAYPKNYTIYLTLCVKS